MLGRLFKAFTSPISLQLSLAKAPKPQPAPRKHMSMQLFVYPSSQSVFKTQSVDLPAKATTPPLSQPDIIQRQKIILANINEFKDLTVEICKLTPRDRVVGVMKHPKPIMGGIIMHPMSMRYSAAWDELTQTAAERQTGIAIFRPTQPITCLKLTNPDTKRVSYLINKDLISLYELVRTARKTVANATAPANSNKIRNS